MFFSVGTSAKKARLEGLVSNGCCILNKPKLVGGVVRRKSETRTARMSTAPRPVKKKKKAVEVDLSDASTDFEGLVEPDGEEPDRQLRARRSQSGTPVTIANMDRIEKENAEAVQEVASLKEKLKDCKKEARLDQLKICSLDKELASVKRAYSAVAPGKEKVSYFIVRDVVGMFATILRVHCS